MDLRGRCQQILTVLRERGPQSIRKLAQATGLPKSSVDRHCKGLRERARQAPEAELWEQEEGAQWLRVLVLAVIFVFGLKGGVGVERLSEFFHRVRLERYLAVSPSALRSLRTQMEAVILAYSAEQEQRFGQAGRRLEMIAGADETFFDQVVVLVMMDLVSGYLVLEEAADHRTYDTWQERVQAAVTRVGLELRYIVSDRAKALIKLALNGLGCPSVPDLFHALRDLAKVMGVSLSLKLAQVEEKLTHARQQLGVVEAKGHDPHVQQRWLAHLSAQAEVLRADRATCQSTLQQASQAVHPFTLAESQAQSSAQVESRLHQAVATLNTLHAAHTARDHCSGGDQIPAPNSRDRRPGRCVVARGGTPVSAAGARRTDPALVPAATATRRLLAGPGGENQNPGPENGLSAGIPPGPGRAPAAPPHRDGDAARVRNLLRLGPRPRRAIPARLLGRRGPQWLSVPTPSLRQRDTDPTLEGDDRDSQLRPQTRRWDHRRRTPV